MKKGTLLGFGGYFGSHIPNGYQNDFKHLPQL